MMLRLEIVMIGIDYNESNGRIAMNILQQTGKKIPLISVLMPVYNGEMYIANAVESILNQSFTDFEFIIIDDCSTDKTLQILESFVDARIQIHRNDTNRRIAYSLNKGMELACGKYIARMDADDISHPNRLEEQINYLQFNTSIGLLGSNVRLFGNIEKVKKHLELPEKNQIRLLFQTCCTHPAIIFRSDIATKHNILYDTDLVPSEDYHFIYRFSKVTKIANLKSILLDYRTFPTEVLATKYNQHRLRTGRKVREKVLSDIGISYTEWELDLHCKICQRIPPLDTSELDSMLDWTEKIYRYMASLTNPDLLRRELNHQWMAYINSNRTERVFKWAFSRLTHPFIKPNFQSLVSYFSKGRI